MFTEEQLKPYFDELNKMPFDDSLVEYLRKFEGEEIYHSLINYTCNVLVDAIQRTFYKYNFKELKNNELINVFIKVSELIKNEELAYYIAVAEFFKGNKSKVLQYLKKAYEAGFFCNDEYPLTEAEFANCFIAPFKGGFEGFWDSVYNMLLSANVEKSVLELCKAVPLFYTSEDSDRIRQALEAVLAINPESKISKELLALSYYDDKLWGNAVAMFEQVEDEHYILFGVDLYFQMAWCYGKLKETANEIAYYEKCAAIIPDGLYVMNNLGSAYYKAKQYNKAIECFQQCLDNDWDVKYAANNFVRTLLAMKRFKDAKAFVRKSPVKIYKTLLERVKNAENANKRIKEDLPIEEAFENEALAVVEKKIDIGVKKQQFTSEKILEDELVLRMDMGLEVFGKHLKIYRRKGIYGRQYILSNGKRLDILAEDNEGNLYIIELKKDSGYDDAYTQTAEYLEWFDKNWHDKSKSIYGIICLNSPTKELLEKVHKDNRIRVFEYKISYTER